MKKTLYYGLISASLLSAAGPAVGGGPKYSGKLVPKRFVTNAEKLRRLAAMEQAAAGKAYSAKPVFPGSSNSSGSAKSINSVSFSDLGQSRNPFTILTSGRNCVSVVPALNTVSFFRRGGLDDPGGESGNAGNKVFMDLNTKGGVDGQWQISTGPIFDDDAYVNDPTHTSQGGANNFGSRYPQGAIWNPAGNTDTANAVAIAIPRVLDGTNDAWGGMGYGWKKLSGSAIKQQVLESSSDPLHFRQESMEVTDNAVFVVEPIEDLSSGSVVFTDRVGVYKFTYNSSNNTLVKSSVFIPFPNQADPEYGIRYGNSAIAFGPDGNTGYMLISAANINFDSIATYAPYISKTTDGGNTWSDLQLIRINKKTGEAANPGLDAFRDKLFANKVYFLDGSIIGATPADSMYKQHYVDYALNDLDMVVDKDNYAHILMNFYINGFGDTLNGTYPVAVGTGFQYFPGIGTWNAHVIYKNQTEAVQGEGINRNVTFEGCWGDCAGSDNFTDANRPQAARSQDGSVIAFAWYDTDTSSFPPQTDQNNSNPDLWVQRVKVTSPGQFAYGPKPLNMTKGSDYDGLAALGNVAPRLLNLPGGGHALASTFATFAEYDPVATTATMPTQHIYAGNVAVPSAVDSFPVIAEPTVMNQNSVGFTFLDGGIFSQDVSAQCTVSVNSRGSFPITMRGVCWSTTPSPTVELSTKTENGSGTGVFDASISGLTPNTMYYLRAYATTALGTVYGDDQMFTTAITSAGMPSVRKDILAVPNPSSGKVNFRGLGVSGTLVVKTILGTEVHRQEVRPGEQVDLSKLNRSTYFYTIETKEGNFFGRVVLN